MISARKMQADSVSKTTSYHDFVCVSEVSRGKMATLGHMDGQNSRMGIGKEFANPKFPKCLSRSLYFAELEWIQFGKLPLCSWHSVQSSPPSLFCSSSACTVTSKNSRLIIIPSFFLCDDWHAEIWKILRLNVLSQGRNVTSHIFFNTNGLHCNFKSFCNWIIFSVFIF